MSDRPIFLRPIHFAPTAEDHFTINSTAVDLAEGVYGDIRMLLGALDDEGASEAAGFNVALNSDYKVVISATGTFTLDFGEVATRSLLGFTANLSGANSYTATYTPSHLWFPTYCQTNQDDFRLKHQDRFVGRTALDGGISGIKLDGGDIYYKELMFNFEPGYNVKDVYARNAFDAERNLDAFLDGVRWAIPDAADMVAVTGFYYFPDYSYARALNTDPSVLEGMNLNYTSTPDTHVFCNIVPGSISKPRPALPVGQTVWDVGFTINTATAPTWVTLA